jgi:hypothetical protein
MRQFARCSPRILRGISRPADDNVGTPETSALVCALNEVEGGFVWINTVTQGQPPRPSRPRGTRQKLLRGRAPYHARQFLVVFPHFVGDFASGLPLSAKPCQAPSAP